MVEELGHRVVAEAGSVRDAEPLAQTSAFDLAILDVNVGGQEINPVAEAIARRGLPFLFVSGYSATVLPAQFSGVPLLRKPFLIEQLNDAINALLDRRGAVVLKSD